MITLENVTVEYPVLQLQAHNLRARIHNYLSRLTGYEKKPLITVFQALRNINITIEAGERVGIIGHNGSGKTTLLRTMSGIFPPVTGSVHIEGQVNNLIDVGMGMEVEISGFKNIILRLVYGGMTFAEAKKHAIEIADFADIGKAVYDPVFTYSAGMTLRLAFAIETFRVSEILIMDEIIGAGDNKFQQTALAKINELIWKSKICIISSHDLRSIKKFCSRCILLQKGQVIEDGTVDNVIAEYLKLSKT